MKLALKTALWWPSVLFFFGGGATKSYLRLLKFLVFQNRNIIIYQLNLGDKKQQTIAGSVQTI